MHLRKSRGIVRWLWMALGLLSFALGTIGIVLPILPTVPFYMITLFCFAKSSRRLHSWFVQSSFYKKHLENFVQNRAMTLRSKLKIMTMVTAMMAAAFILMPFNIMGALAMAAAWIIHVLYFIFGIKTVSAKTLG